jgi:hypothetical protein
MRRDGEGSMNIIRTAHTYKTVENAKQGLSRAAGGRDIETMRYLIAVAPDGRFAPVLVGVEYLGFIHVGITVVGG